MKKIDLDMSSIITDYESGKSAAQIAAALGVHKTTIARQLAKSGYKMRTLSHAHQKYTVRENYFKVIDDSDKAYLLGLIYADGSMMPSRNTMEICLQEDDHTLLEILSSKIYDSYKPLGFREAKAVNFNGKLYHCKPMYRLTVTNKTMFADLTLLGLPANKSLILKFPTTDMVPRHLLSHFIRGYYDGDGCLSYNMTSKNAMIRILGTEDFCNGVKNEVAELGIRSYVSKRSNTNIFHISITGNRQVGNLLIWLYKDSNLHMQRKYDKFESLITNGILLKN